MFLLEPLESRTLLAANPIPPATLTAYNQLIHDSAVLKSDLSTFTKALLADVALLAKDAKSLPKNSTTTALVNEAKKDAATVKAADTAATNKYVAMANPTFKKTELAIAAFTDAPSLANGHKLTAQINACNVLKNAELIPAISTQVQKASDAAVDLETTLNTLATNNPSAASLNTHIQAALTDIQNLNNIQGDDGDTAEADIQPLLQS